jgi:PBSX family phage terminase large subunit
MRVDLSNIICDAFQDIVTDIVQHRVGRLILKGGRASTKSQTAAESIIMGCMVNKQSAVALVKYGNKIKDRLVDTFTSSIKYLGVEKYWKLRKSPYEYVLLDAFGHETDISIKFTGCDNAETLKSFRSRGQGGFGYVWFEEVTNFYSLKEVNNIVQTMSRGQNSLVIMSYNPPQSTSNWVNKEYDAPCGTVLGYNTNSYIETVNFVIGQTEYTVKQKVHHSTYLDVIKAGHSDWLGLNWIAQAESAKENNNLYYRWAYLGEVVGTEANVFSNINDWTYIENPALGWTYNGADMSNGGKDPYHYGKWLFDKQNNDLYCLDELRLAGSSKVTDFASEIKRHGIGGNTLYMDSAVPTFIRQMQSAGLAAFGSKKHGDNGRIAGIQWLRSMNHIYIDKVKCPSTYKEFKEYEYIINKNDEITNDPQHDNDHSIDTCRYALSTEIRDISNM